MPDHDQLPFGRTETTTEELRSLVDTETAIDCLAVFDAREPDRQVERFYEDLPQLLRWLEANGRDYPWRNTTDPWAVYLAEILLQRTRGDAVEPVYRRLRRQFPSPQDLHEADETEIKPVIEELGFGNQRTRTLNAAAQLVVEEHSGTVPRTLEELKKPWRVGPYSARACLLFATGRPLALVDANFARVFSRYFECNFPKQPHKSDAVYELFEALVPNDAGLARSFNLAVLDLGAKICTASDPACERCPLQTACWYHATD